MVVHTKAWESYHYCKYCPILLVFVDFSAEPKAIIHLRKTLLCMTLKCVWQFLFFPWFSICWNCFKLYNENLFMFWPASSILAKTFITKFGISTCAPYKRHLYHMMSEFLQVKICSHMYFSHLLYNHGYEAIDLCSSTCKLRNFTFADFIRVAEWVWNQLIIKCLKFLPALPVALDMTLDVIQRLQLK